MSATPSIFEGQVIVHVRLTAKPGTGDEVAAAFELVRQSANSEEEPGTLEFRVARHGDEFMLFEQYVNKEAIAMHSATNAFHKLQGVLAELREGDPIILFYEGDSPAPKL